MDGEIENEMNGEPYSEGCDLEREFALPWRLSKSFQLPGIPAWQSAVTIELESSRQQPDASSQKKKRIITETVAVLFIPIHDS
jgi:hypothetical protein